jgi:tetratricopeptide (TPR) repeat protein
MSRLLLSVAALGFVLGACSFAAREARRGQQLYAKGSYRESYEAFQRALKAQPNLETEFALGTSLYRLKRYEEAARAFRKTAVAPRLQRQSYYNLGNASVRAAEESADKGRLLNEAVSAYEQVLRIEPGDSAAKWNLELALRRLGEDRESGGSSGRGRSADYGSGNMNVPGYEGNPEAAVGAMAGGGFGAGEGESAEELSESEARQLLEAVEREQLSSHQGNPALRGGSSQLDW